MGIDQTAIEIANEHLDNPVIADALNYHSNRKLNTTSSFDCLGEGFQDIFNLLAFGKYKNDYTPSPRIKDISAPNLLIALTKMIDKNAIKSERKDTEAAINALVKPITEALIERIKQNDMGNLSEETIIDLYHKTKDAAQNFDWLTEDNKKLLNGLSSQAVSSWLRLKTWENKTTSSKTREVPNSLK